MLILPLIRLFPVWAAVFIRFNYGQEEYPILLPLCRINLGATGTPPIDRSLAFPELFVANYILLWLFIFRMLVVHPLPLYLQSVEKTLVWKKCLFCAVEPLHRSIVSHHCRRVFLLNLGKAWVFDFQETVCKSGKQKLLLGIGLAELEM